MRTVIRLARWSSFLVLLSVLMACRRQPNTVTIEYVVPAGFRGPFFVCQDRSGIENIKWLGGTAVITVGTDGVAHTQSALPSRGWHQKKARYADGSELPVESSAGAPDNAIVLRRAADEVDKEWLVVGDRQDLKRAFEKIDGFKWPPE